MSRLTLPEPVDLVSAEEVNATIAQIDRDLSDLERRADEASTRADIAESRAAELGIDGKASTWAMVRLQRFLDGLRAENDHDIDEMLDVAKARAAARLEEADAAAIAIMRPGAVGREPRNGTSANNGAATAPTPVAPTPVASAAPVVPPALLDVEDPAIASMSAIAFDQDSASAGVVDAPPIAVAPVAVAPVVVAPVPEPVVEAPAPVAAAPAPVIEAPAPAAAAPVIVAPVVVPPGATEAVTTETPDAAPTAEPSPAVHTTPATVADPMTEPAPSADAQEFWPEAEAPKKKGFLRRIPVSAILEILAVVLILVFILLRLS